jgi:hypothetical protein
LNLESHQSQPGIPVRIELAPGRSITGILSLPAEDLAAASTLYSDIGPSSFSELVRSSSSSSTLSDGLASMSELQEELAAANKEMGDVSLDVNLDEQAQVAAIGVRKRGIFMVSLSCAPEVVFIATPSMPTNSLISNLCASLWP